MTEAEAKQRWCPFARAGIYAGDGGVAVNRSATISMTHDETRCVGSNCMAWRWRRMQVGRQGFCGLAGEPVGHYTPDREEAP